VFIQRDETRHGNATDRQRWESISLNVSCSF
jgi:hypothetical protein